MFMFHLNAAWSSLIFAKVSVNVYVHPARRSFLSRDVQNLNVNKSNNDIAFFRKFCRTIESFTFPVSVLHTFKFYKHKNRKGKIETIPSIII